MQHIMPLMKPLTTRRITGPDIKHEICKTMADEGVLEPPRDGPECNHWPAEKHDFQDTQSLSRQNEESESSPQDEPFKVVRREQVDVLRLSRFPKANCSGEHFTEFNQDMNEIIDNSENEVRNIIQVLT